MGKSRYTSLQREIGTANANRFSIPVFLFSILYELKLILYFAFRDFLGRICIRTAMAPFKYGYAFLRNLKFTSFLALKTHSPPKIVA